MGKITSYIKEDGTLQTIDENNGLPVVSSLSAGIVSPSDYVNEYLTLNGAGASNDMAIDGTTPKSFSYTPPTGKDLIAGRVMIYYEASTGFSSEKFGHIVALTNGVEININGTTLDTWKDNIDVIEAMFDLSNAGTTFSNSSRSLAGRWTLFRANGNKRGLRVDNGNIFEFNIQDNLSTLTFFRAKLQGILVNTPT